MRSLLLPLVLLTACVKRPHPNAVISTASATSPACPLHVVPNVPTLSFPDTQQAVHAFDRAPDTAYVVLYIRRVAGYTGTNRCLLVRQQASTHFLVTSYGAQCLDSVVVTDATWHLSLAQLAAAPGHLYSMCMLTTDPSIEFLVVKHQGKIVFSLSWDTYRLSRLPEADEARLVPALTLMRRFRA